jgi:putative aminopeptidase FrvX
MVLNQTSNNQVVDIAGKLKIPYQLNILESSGTDYGAIHLHRRLMRTQFRV